MLVVLFKYLFLILVSDYFGFGVLDALALVNNAIKWNVSAPPQKKCEIPQA